VSNQPSQLSALLNKQQEGIEQVGKDVGKMKAQRIFLDLQGGFDVSPKDLDYFEQYAAENLAAKVRAGEAVSEKQAAFLKNYIETKSPKALGFKKQLESFAGDIGLRFQEGFLDKPELTQKLVNAKLKKQFPGQQIETRIKDSNVEFSVGGSEFVSLDPSEGDPIGETAEQVGRFAEPVAAIASGFIPGAQVAAPAAVTAIAQTGRETLEGLQGLNDQSLMQRFSDIGLKTGFDALVGNFFKGLGKGSRGLERKYGGSAEVQQRAGKILEEKAARNVEDFYQGSNPEVFAKELQSKLKNTLGEFQKASKSAFQTGDKLALAELRSGRALPLPMGEQIAQFKAANVDDVFVEGFNKNIFDNIFESMNKMRTQAGVAPLQNLDNLTTFDLQKGVEVVDKQLKNITKNDINFNVLKNIKGLFRNGQQQLAEAGSPSALNFTKGAQILKQQNDLFPEDLAEKALGKVGDYGREKVVPAKKFLSNIVSSSGFNDQEIAQIAKFSGLAGDDILADIAGTQIKVTSSPEFQQKAGKNLVAYVLPKFTENRTGERLIDLPEKVVEQARKVVDVPSQDVYQRAGGKIKPDLFTDVVRGENIKIIDPNSEKFIGQPVINARSALKNLRNQSGEIGEGFVEGTGKVSALVGDDALGQAIDPLEQLKYAQEVAQKQFIKEGTGALENVGQNTIRTGVNFAVAPGAGNLLTETAGPAIRSVARLGGLAGRAIETAPGLAPKRSVISALTQEDEDSPINKALRTLMGGGK